MENLDNFNLNFKKSLPQNLKYFSSLLTVWKQLRPSSSSPSQYLYFCRKKSISWGFSHFISSREICKVLPLVFLLLSSTPVTNDPHVAKSNGQFPCLTGLDFSAEHLKQVLQFLSGNTLFPLLPPHYSWIFTISLTVSTKPPELFFL